VISHALISPISIEEYLAKEQLGEIRHEYIAGHVFAMVGASRAHNTIALNIASFLHASLRGSPCQVFMADMKVRVEKAEAFYYPDVVVTCEPRDNDAFFLRAPSLIVEVLSPTTEGIDRREKRLAYQRLESLKEYVLAAQETPRMEIYRRSEANAAWEIHIYEGDECAVLQALDLKLPLQIAYEGID
jgi:Uma2 family endonuclease